MILAFALLVPASAMAYTARSNDNIYISPSDMIDGSFYAVGSNINIEGVINGDLICAGDNLSIKGIVEGSVICAAGTINIDGGIKGNARLLGQSININGNIDKNLNALGASIVINSNADIGKEALLAGASADIKGRVNGDLHGALEKLFISGKIDKNVKMRLGGKSAAPLIISETALIDGNLHYTASAKGEISDKAQIGGETGFTLLEARKNKSWVLGSLGLIFSIFAALTVGMVLISLFKEQTRAITDKMIGEINRSIFTGFAIMFLTPIICMLLLFTIIGLPLSIIILSLWLIALYFGKILAGIMIGRSIIEKFWATNKDSIIWSMILGIIIFWILGSLPILGWLISLAGICWGLGGIWMYFKR
jgi:hypothetical protein